MLGSGWRAVERCPLRGVEPGSRPGLLVRGSRVGAGVLEWKGAGRPLEHELAALVRCGGRRGLGSAQGLWVLGNTVNENSAGADERVRFTQMELVCKTQLVDS